MPMREVCQSRLIERRKTPRTTGNPRWRDWDSWFCHLLVGHDGQCESPRKETYEKGKNEAQRKWDGEPGETTRHVKPWEADYDLLYPPIRVDRVRDRRNGSQPSLGF